jgi:hypothetical protein
MAKLKTQATYAEMRNVIRPGDIIAFSGHDRFSRRVQAETGSPIDSLGTVMQTKLSINGRAANGTINQLLHTVRTGDVEELRMSRLSHLIDNFDGTVVLFQLNFARRKQADFQKFFDTLLHGPTGRRIQRSALEKLPFIGHRFEKDFRTIMPEWIASAMHNSLFAVFSLAEFTAADVLKAKPLFRNPIILKGAEIDLSAFTGTDDEETPKEPRRPRTARVSSPDFATPSTPDEAGLNTFPTEPIVEVAQICEQIAEKYESAPVVGFDPGVDEGTVTFTPTQETVTFAGGASAGGGASGEW